MRIPARLLLLAAAAFAGCVGSPLEREVDAAIQELVACPELRGGRVGVQVVDAATGGVLGGAMADRGFAPASNQKLITSSVALETLGAEHRLRTRLCAKGRVEGGRLHGDLVVVGGGDPTFAEPSRAAEQWRAFADGLGGAGIERVAGQVRGDGSWLGGESLGLGWQWDYLDEDYAAPFGGLCAAGNVIDVRVTPSSAGVLLALVPPHLDLQAWVVGDVQQVVGNADDAVRVGRRLGRDRVELSGTIGEGSDPVTRRVTVRDPAAFAAAVTAGGLRSVGVVVEGGETGASGELRELAVVESPPVGEVIGPLLTDSNNLYAEQLFRVAARFASGSGTTTAAAQHATKTLESLGVPTRGLVLADGSGLSRRNLVAPSQLTRLLLAAHEAPWREAFVAGLPVAGLTGTLRSRFAEGPARGRVRAKTGFISRVACLSGYVPRPAGEPLVFSVMLNDFTCETPAAKDAIDRFVQRLAAAVGW